MLQIKVSVENPSGYIRKTDIEPVLTDDGILLYDYTEGFNKPGSNSTILLNAEDLIVIHVGYTSKGYGSQFYHYFQVVNGEWQTVTWRNLSDEDRARVLLVYKNRPGPIQYAKVPGKLRTAYNKPVATILTTYKIVSVCDDGRMVSCFDPSVEYTLGKLLVQKAIDGHQAGYYSYPYPDDLAARLYDGNLFPEKCYDLLKNLALIECEISGTILKYRNQGFLKYCSTYLRPTRVLQTFTYSPQEQLQEAM